MLERGRMLASGYAKLGLTSRMQLVQESARHT
jgi:hypothetical protein